MLVVCLDVFAPIDQSEYLNVSAPKSKESFPLIFGKNGQDGTIHGVNKTINTVITKLVNERTKSQFRVPF